MVRPLAVRRVLRAQKAAPLVKRSSSAHEDRQAQHAVDDRGHAGQVVDVGLDEAASADDGSGAARVRREERIAGVLLQVDGRAHAQREGDQDGDQQQSTASPGSPCAPRRRAAGWTAGWSGSCQLTQERNESVARGIVLRRSWASIALRWNREALSGPARHDLRLDHLGVDDRRSAPRGLRSASGCSRSRRAQHPRLSAGPGGRRSARPGSGRAGAPSPPDLAGPPPRSAPRPGRRRR